MSRRDMVCHTQVYDDVTQAQHGVTHFLSDAASTIQSDRVTEALLEATGFLSGLTHGYQHQTDWPETVNAVAAVVVNSWPDHCQW